MVLQALIKGWIGEAKTKVSQKVFLDSKQYHIFNSIIVHTGSMSTQIDHVIVSKHGVFVVETKEKSGWIFGSVHDNLWTQVIFDGKVRFQNPLRQNYSHTRGLAEFLEIDHAKIHSLIVFWGDCEFRTPMPDNVVKGIYEYISYIRSKKQILLTNEEVDRICKKIQDLKDHTTFLSNIRHVYSVKKGHTKKNVCPKCGGNLVMRTARSGKRRGESFIGCANYPRCTYKRGMISN